MISTQVSGVSVAMGDALQPGDLLVTIKEASTTEADDDDEALAARILPHHTPFPLIAWLE